MTTSPFMDRLAPLLVAGDVTGAWELLDSIEGDSLREARQWCAKARIGSTQIRDLMKDVDFDHDYDRRSEVNANATWIVGLCAVWLCGPVTAAKKVPWRDLWDHDGKYEGAACFVQLLWEKDRAWVADFVEAAADVSLGGNGSATLSRVLRAAVTHHGLPAPRGKSFYLSWLEGTPWSWSSQMALARRAQGDPSLSGPSLVEWLTVDPLMPDALFHLLSSGHSGREPWLPAVVGELVERGALSRTAVLEHVLQLLTSPQLPGAQKVLGKILQVLVLRPDEVPGGLTYLLGVISTSTGAVGLVLLPLALALVSDGDGLVELTSVLTARSEKKQKRLLLDALAAPELRLVAGIGAVEASLALLWEDDDATFAGQVARVTEAAGVSVASSATAPSMGLWQREPTPTGIAPERHWAERRPSWSHLLDNVEGTRYASERAWLLDHELCLMAEGRFHTHSLLQRDALTLLVTNLLSASRLIGVMEDLFLVGGLRHAWPVAMVVAEEALTLAKPLSGLADLLRLLVRYAVEVPEQQLPARLAGFAAGKGGTKARVEARQLGAALDRRPLEGRLAGVSTPIVVAPRRLWTIDPSRIYRPEETRLRELDWSPAELRRGARSYLKTYYTDSHRSLNPDQTGITIMDRLLAAVVNVVHRHGPAAARRALERTSDRRARHGSVVVAVDAWLLEQLDVPTFWQLAQDPRTEPTLREQDSGSAYQPSFIPAVSSEHNVLVLRERPAGALERLAFLRACEGLLGTAERGVLLSTPTYADGSIDFTDLIARLRADNGALVGPIDLVQALHRLRPVDPVRAAEVGSEPVWTQPETTSPAGVEVWDAADVIRHWVGSGGLQPRDPVADVDQSVWIHDAVDPVPWSRLGACPDGLRTDPWAQGSAWQRIALTPWWPDRAAIWDPFEEGRAFRELCGTASGPLGLPWHDLALSFLAVTTRDHVVGAVISVAEASVLRRISPRFLVEAGAVRRERGTLGLARLAPAVAGVFERGGLAGLWPAALALAASLCEGPTPPEGLALLLHTLTSYAHEVPEREVPVELSAFAAEPGVDPAHVQARALVQALEAA